jgi:hypothetical protein
VGQRGRGQDLLDRAAVAVDDQQHQAAHVVGQLGVEVQLQCPRGAREVATLDQDQVGLGVQAPERLQDALEQLVVLAAVGEGAQVVHGDRVRLLVRLGQAVPAADQLDVGIGLGGRGDHRAEVADPAELAGQRVDQAERDHRLAAARLDGGQVDVASLAVRRIGHFHHPSTWAEYCTGKHPSATKWRPRDSSDG